MLLYLTALFCFILTVNRRWRSVFSGRQLRKRTSTFLRKKCIRVTWLEDFRWRRNCTLQNCKLMGITKQKQNIVGLPHGYKNIVQDSRVNVAVIDFCGASITTSESIIHFFHMQNTWAPTGVFPGVGKLGIWKRKSPSGIQGWRVSTSKAPRSRRQVVKIMMMESPVGTTYELRSHSLLPVGPRMTDKVDSCGELSTAVITGIKRLVSADLAAGTD